MSKSASVALLEQVHKKLAKNILDQLTRIEAGEAELTSSFIASVSAFLKANEITADVGESDDLAELRRRLSSLGAESIVASAQDTEYLN